MKMTNNEGKRINRFIKAILDSDKRLSTQLPGDKEHTIVLPLNVILNEWGSMVKDLESMKDESEKH